MLGYSEGMVICLKRNAIQNLINWKSSEERKPMVLKGARQVGKTWLMKENRKDGYITNLPLYLVRKTKELL